MTTSNAPEPAPRVLSFTHDPHPTRVVFAAGALERLAEEVDRLGSKRVLLIAPSRLSAIAAGLLGARVAGRFEDAVQHVPAEIASRACALARERSVDGVVALGGGSSVGLAKIVAREVRRAPAPGDSMPGAGDSGLPIVAVPTTYSGSEMTSIWGLTEGGQKRTGRDPVVRPRVAIYDPRLLASLPARTAGPSGLNAIAHAVEALYAPGVDPITQVLAEEAARAIAGHLAGVVAAGESPASVDVAETLYGAWLAGVCLDRAAMGVHHKLCHVLGGTFQLPHAEVHAVVLPHAARFNRDAAPEAMRRLGRALGASDVPGALFELARRAGAPRSLADLGMRAADLDRAAELATQSPYASPRPIDRAGVRALLEDAFTGVVAP